MRLKAVFASLLSAILLMQPMWGQIAPETAPVPAQVAKPRLVAGREWHPRNLIVSVDCGAVIGSSPCGRAR